MTAASSRPDAPIGRVRAAAYRIPTDQPESDGTLAWDATTIVIAEVEAGGTMGLGYTYADPATATLVNDLLAGVVAGRDPLDIPAAWWAMVRAIRNLGRPGIASMAIAAVDAALWDLKGRLLGLSVARLLGRAQEAVELYGSGGFTSYTDRQLHDQLAGWAEQGLHRVKMKVGREPGRDVERVEVARRAIGPTVELFVDANGAYDRREALRLAVAFDALGVTWFEEPVSSDDLEGLHFIRGRTPPAVAVAAGEYGYDQTYFHRMLAAGAVDVLQADATRCAGPTGFLAVGALADAFHIPLSSHCAPSLHVPFAAALANVRHMEYFHDHVRIEHLLFDGTPEAHDGRLAPDLDRPGLGLDLRRSDAEAWRCR